MPSGLGENEQYTDVAFCVCVYDMMGFPGGSAVKNLPAVLKPWEIPGSGRSPGGGLGNPFQYSCLAKIPWRGAWQAIVHEGHKESDTTERLTYTFLS